MSDLDPVLRCDSCQALIKVETLHKVGCCLKCGNKRVRSVIIANDKEIQQIRAWGYAEMANSYSPVEVADD